MEEERVTVKAEALCKKNIFFVIIYYFFHFLGIFRIVVLSSLHLRQHTMLGCCYYFSIEYENNKINGVVGRWVRVILLLLLEKTSYFKDIVRLTRNNN